MSCQHSYLTHPNVVVTLLLLFAPEAWAAPLSDLVKRDGSSSSSKIAAPIIAAVVFLIAVPMVFYRKSLFKNLPPMHFPSMRMRQRQRPSPMAVRDLTAEEIAGTATTNQAQGATTTRSTRRTGRNNRRTPSQISTRSLPVYMKEPGEEELVIIQGSQDMEDAPLTAQVVMPSVREDEDESTNSHSRGPSQASYVNINDDPLAQTPLLERNVSNENTHERQVSAASVDISDVLHDLSSPLPNDPETEDPRGEAPPYFEVVGNPWDDRATSEDLARVDTADTLPIAPDVLPERSAAGQPTRRRSMFRGLIDAASRALSSPHPPHPMSQALPLSRPSRDTAVSASPRPSNLSNRQGATRSPLTGHRATPSTTGSVQSVTSSAFGRAVSRTRSRSVTNVAAGLTSPSAISIASISAPLTHTAVRTDFVYPRSGPTPEQLKLISSVESVSKFGVPYGRDAVAYASASLVNLHGPPPGFEERPSTDGLPGSSSGETRARASSALSRVSRDGNTRESMSSLPSSLRESTVAAEPAGHDSDSTSSRPDRETRSPTSGLNNNNGASSPRPEPSEDKKEQQADTPVANVPPRVPSPSPTVGTTSTAVTVTRATEAELGVVPESPIMPGGHRPALPSPFVAETAAPATATTAPKPIVPESPTMPGGHRPALPSPIVAETVALATATTARKPVAPSSFRMPPSGSQGRLHPASRSSSMETFRTAASEPEERGASDMENENETDAFTDAESGAEADGETPPATPQAVLRVENTVLGSERPTVSV